MENNWKEKVINMLNNSNLHLTDEHQTDKIANVVLKAMNLVFKSTKKKCLDKVLMNENDWRENNWKTKEVKTYNNSGDRVVVTIDEESILNITKEEISLIYQ